MAGGEQLGPHGGPLPLQQGDRGGEGGGLPTGPAWAPSEEQAGTGAQVGAGQGEGLASACEISNRWVLFVLQ